MRSRVKDFGEYLDILRVQIGRHGLDKVSSKNVSQSSLMGFTTPDGWWTVSAQTIKTAAKREVKIPKGGNPDLLFIEWFQRKMHNAIKDGERLHKEGFS